jgi:hypothetical protein
MENRLNRLEFLAAATRPPGRSGRALAATLLIALLTAAAPAAIGAAECPLKVEPRIPPPREPFIDPNNAVNIDILKKQLIEYKEGRDGKPGNYDEDVTQVFDRALDYVKQRVAETRGSADEGKTLAVVLDIDETSLSNWPNLKANNFGFIKGGPCFEEPNLSCGFDEWILKASARAIPPALKFFNDVIKMRSVAVFFITGRSQSQRQATLSNLDNEGFQGFAELRTHGDGDPKSVVEYKSGHRKVIESRQYKIIATIGDQHSDLKGGAAECTIKVPNPFYLIP